MRSLRTRYMQRQTRKVITAAIDRDDRTAAMTLSQIGRRYGASGVFQLCHALCFAVHAAVFPNISRGDGSLTGDHLAVIEVDGQPTDPMMASALWAGRFLTAYLNGDDNTMLSLFNSAPDIDTAAANVASLIQLTGDVMRQLEHEFCNRVVRDYRDDNN